MRKFNKDELDNMDFKAYLATSSEEEEAEAEEEDEEKKDEGQEFSDVNKSNESKDDEDERIDKYKVNEMLMYLYFIALTDMKCCEEYDARKQEILSVNKRLWFLAETLLLDKEVDRGS